MLQRYLLPLATCGIILVVIFARYAPESSVVSLRAALLIFVLSILGIAGTLLRHVVKHALSAWTPRLLTWLERRYILPAVMRYKSTYLEDILIRHGIFNVRGLRTRSPTAVKLDDVFVQLRVAPASLNALRANPLGPAVGRQSLTLWECLRNTSSPYRHVAVIGPPGSGKTTLLQHLALRLAARVGIPHEVRQYVPVLLFLRDHVRKICEATDKYLPSLIEDVERSFGREPPNGWFEDQLRKGRCLVMFDGLDEVADADDRRRVAHWVDRQFQIFGKNRFVVTSRPHGFIANPLAGVTVLEVQPFVSADIQRFIRNWYFAYESASLDSPPDQIARIADVAAADLIDRVLRTKALAALAVNPLLLTMIALVHKHCGRLPEKRIELFSEICTVLLQSWNEAKTQFATQRLEGQVAHGYDRLTISQKRLVLEQVAFHMMLNNQRNISCEEVESIVHATMGQIEDARSVSVKAFLEAVVRFSGLLLEKEAGVYSFAHQVFQEYLAATHLVSTHRSETALNDRVQDPWWHEVIRLVAAQCDATNIIRTCLRAAESAKNSTQSIKAITLAYQCLVEAQIVDSSIRREIYDFVVEGLRATDEVKRRHAAEVLLSIRLSGLLRLSDAVYIDTALVTSAEYELFMISVGEAASEMRPIHWCDGNTISGGQYELPICGVSHEQAHAFCEWVTQRVRKEGSIYAQIRLPSHSEHTDVPVGMFAEDSLFPDALNHGVGAWCDGPRSVNGVSETEREVQADILRQASLDIACDTAVTNALSVFLDGDGSSCEYVKERIQRRQCEADVVLTADHSLMASRSRSDTASERPGSSTLREFQFTLPLPLVRKATVRTETRKVTVDRDTSLSHWLWRFIKWMHNWGKRLANTNGGTEIVSGKDGVVPGAAYTSGVRSSVRSSGTGTSRRIRIPAIGQRAKEVIELVVVARILSDRAVRPEAKDIEVESDGFPDSSEYPDSDDFTGEKIVRKVVPIQRAPEVSAIEGTVLHYVFANCPDVTNDAAAILVGAEIAYYLADVARTLGLPQYGVRRREWEVIGDGLMEAFWKVQLLSLRRSGRLRAVEGIRIVRKTNDSSGT